MLKIAYYRNKTLNCKTLKGLVKWTNGQTGNPKSSQQLPQSLEYREDFEGFVRE